MNKLILNINIFLFLLIPSLVLAVPSTDTYETWDANEGTTTDNAIWIDDDIDFEVNGITDYDADFVCFDWDDDETYDNCYYDSNGCGGSCNTESCNYYAVPNNMNDDWKESCDVEGDCREGTNVNERVCDGCDFDTSNIQSIYVDAVVYYDCENNYSNRHVDPLDEVHFWVVYPKKYDCDSDSGESGDDKSGTAYYDFEGKIGSTSWLDIKSDVSCPSYRVCDPDSSHTYHDDQEVTSRTGSITHPCTLEDGTTSNHACSSDNDCYSDDCGQQDIWTFVCSLDGDTEFNKSLENYHSSCGGQGYFNDFASEMRYCDTDVGAGYVCDSDLDYGPYYGTYNSDWLNDFCKKGPHQSCSVNSDCWNDNGGYDCIGSSCEKCGDSYCGGPGETPSNCPSDCCSDDCRKIPGEGPPSSDTCYSACDDYNGCNFYNIDTENACDGKDKGDVVCVDSNTYVTCCEGTPVDCDTGEVCSNGQCVAGNETDLAILDVIPIQVIPNVDMVKYKSGYVRVIVHNYGPLNATGQVNVTFDGTSLTPYNPANASKFIIVNTNETFDFNFKPEVAGNNKVISANVTILS